MPAQSRSLFGRQTRKSRPRVPRLGSVGGSNRILMFEDDGSWQGEDDLVMQSLDSNGREESLLPEIH